jgi:hypothetical protein
MASARGARGAWLILALVVLVGGALVADRVSARLSEQALGRETRADLARYSITMTADPSVHISGFPFLTQVISGDYGQVRISAHDLSSAGIELADLTVVGTGVHAPLSAMTGGGGTLVADHLSGTATVPWAQVSALLTRSGLVSGPVQAEPVGDDQVRLSLPVSMGVGTYQVDLTGGVGIAGGQAVVTIDGATVQGAAVPEAVLALVRRYTTAQPIPLPIPPLPYQLHLTDVRTTTAGVVVSATSEHVPIVLGR